MKWMKFENDDCFRTIKDNFVYIIRYDNDTRNCELSISGVSNGGKQSAKLKFSFYRLFQAKDFAELFANNRKVGD